MGDQAMAAALKVTAISIVSALGQDEEEDDLKVLVRVEAPQQVVANKHPPIDLVVVVDVSGSMGWLPDQNKQRKRRRMDYLKASLRFIIDELRDDDRLSIIQFNGSVKSSSPLSPISGGGREWARRLVDSLSPGDGTAFKPALEKAISILHDRDEESSSRRVPFIFLLSDGEESEGSTKTQWEKVIEAGSNHPLREVLGKYPVHTFGVANFHDPRALLAIARISCGTYSYIDGHGLDNITAALAVCLGGLSTVAAKNAAISLSTATGVTIVDIDSGGYNKLIDEDGASGEVRIPMLYEGEVKNFIVRLRVLRTEAAETEGQLLLTAGGTYVDAACAPTTIIIGDHQLFIRRPAGCCGQQYCNKAVVEQVTRFELLCLLEELLLLKDKELLRNNGGKWADWHWKKWTEMKNGGANRAQWLRQNWKELKNSSGLSRRSFDEDVEVMAGKLEQGSGQAYVCSYVSSHQMERTTIMGSHAADYKTPATTRMAEN